MFPVSFQHLIQHRPCNVYVHYPRVFNQGLKGLPAVTLECSIDTQFLSKEVGLHDRAQDGRKCTSSKGVNPCRIVSAPGLHDEAGRQVGDLADIRSVDRFHQTVASLQRLDDPDDVVRGRVESQRYLP